MTISTSEVQEHLGDLLERVGTEKERVTVAHLGQPFAVLVPLEDAQLLEDIEDRLDLEEARSALVEAQGEETIPWETLKAQLGLQQETPTGEKLDRKRRCSDGLKDLAGSAPDFPYPDELGPARRATTWGRPYTEENRRETERSESGEPEGSEPEREPGA